MASKAKHKSNPNSGSKKHNDSNLTSDDIKKFTTIENGILTISSRIAHKLRHKGFAQAEALGINSYFKVSPDGKMDLYQTFDKLEYVPIERYEVEKSRRAIVAAEKTFSQNVESVAAEEEEDSSDGDDDDKDKEENLGFEKKILDQMRKTLMLKEIGIKSLDGIEEKGRARFFSLFEEYAKLHECLSKESVLHQAVKKWGIERQPKGLVNLLNNAEAAKGNLAGLLVEKDLDSMSAKDVKERKEENIDEEHYFLVKAMVNFKGKEVNMLKVFKDLFMSRCRENWVDIYADYSVQKMVRDNSEMTDAAQNFEKEKISVSHVKPGYSLNFLDLKEIRKEEMNRGPQKGLLGLEKEIRELAIGSYPKEMGNKFDLVGFMSYEDKAKEIDEHEHGAVGVGKGAGPPAGDKAGGTKGDGTSPVQEDKKDVKWQKLPVLTSNWIEEFLVRKTKEQTSEHRKKYYDHLEEMFMCEEVNETHVLRGSILGQLGVKNRLLQEMILAKVNDERHRFRHETADARTKVQAYAFKERAKIEKRGPNFYTSFEKEKEKKKEEKKKKEKNKFGKNSSSHHANERTLEQKTEYQAICHKIVDDISIAAKKQVLEKVLQIENPFLREKTFDKVISLAGGYVAAKEDSDDDNW